MGKTQKTLQAVMKWCAESARGVLAVLALVVMYPPTIVPVSAALSERIFEVLLMAYGWVSSKTLRWEAWAFKWSDRIAGA